MADTLFGSVVPVWPAMPAPPLGWFQAPIAAGNRVVSPGVPNAPGVGPLTADAYGYNAGLIAGPAVPPAVPPALSNPFGAVAFPAAAATEIGASAAPALVAAVAMRRGQPLGPTSDQE